MNLADFTRERKVRVTLAAILALFLGLLACLGVAATTEAAGIGLLAGLYTPFAAGVGGALALFINGNVKVHQAQAEKTPP
jgi:predicted histidine transporter YuiF (NhaC family)